MRVQDLERTLLHLLADSDRSLLPVDSLQSLLRLDIVDVHPIRVVEESHEPALFLLFLHFLSELLLHLLFIGLPPLLVREMPAPVRTSFHVSLEHCTHRGIPPLREHGCRRF